MEKFLAKHMYKLIAGCVVVVTGAYLSYLNRTEKHIRSVLTEESVERAIKRVEDSLKEHAAQEGDIDGAQ